MAHIKDLQSSVAFNRKSRSRSSGIRRVVQRELMPELRSEIGPLTSKLEKAIRMLEWVRIEEFVESSWRGVGRSPHDRGALASAFVAKAVLGLRSQAG